MKINRTLGVTVVLVGLLLGGLAAGALFSQKVDVNAAPPAQQGSTEETNEANDNEAGGEVNGTNETADTEQADTNEAAEPQSGNEANEANESQSSGEVDENAALQSQAGLTADEAKVIAEQANPGAKATDIELGQANENSGAVVYDVELDNGVNILVDANSGAILSSTQGEKD